MPLKMQPGDKISAACSMSYDMDRGKDLELTVRKTVSNKL